MKRLNYAGPKFRLHFVSFCYRSGITPAKFQVYTRPLVSTVWWECRNLFKIYTMKEIIKLIEKEIRKEYEYGIGCINSNTEFDIDQLASRIKRLYAAKQILNSDMEP